MSFDGAEHEKGGLRAEDHRREQLRIDVAVPLREASRPEPSPPLGLSGRRTPGSLARRETRGAARVAIPALFAFMAGVVLDGIGPGLLLGLAVALVAAPLRRFPMPLQLMPATRIVFAVMPAVLGCGAFALTGLIGPRPLDLGTGTAAAAAAAAIVAALAIEAGSGWWLRRQPLRIASLDAPEYAVAIERELQEINNREARMVGWLDTSGTRASPDLGREALRVAVLRNRIDLVVRVDGGQAAGPEEPRVDAVEAMLDLPVRMINGEQLYEALFGHVPMGAIDSRWYLYLLHPQFHSTRPAADRIIELAMAIPLLLLFSPVLLLAAALIRIEGGGGVIYRQLRVGEGGREFEILKLRTMAPSPEGSRPSWSSAADSRVTRVGRVLRRLHLDEIPQLVNVLRGEMTFVGPRPEQPQMVASLERTFPHYRRRHLVKPGVTGWAQVRCGYAGSTLGTAWKLCHDLYYMKRRSRLVNAMVLVETIAIAGLDSHRPMRTPASQFLFGLDLGLDLSADADTTVPEGAGALPVGAARE